MIILGIDPGTATTGWGCVKKTKSGLVSLGCGVIKTKKQTEASQRLKEIYQGVGLLIKKFQPEMIAIERLFFFKNLKTALPVSEARGVVLLLACQKNLILKQFTPLEVKMGICGYGRADKTQVQKMVKEILQLKKIPKPDDAADGLALAICASFSAKSG